MSFLDKIKQQATDVATTVVDKTQETAKTGQIQIQLRNLKNEEKDALVALGGETYRLHQEGRLTESSAADTLDSLVASVNDVRSRIAAKEHEMASKSGDEAEGDTVESEAEEVSPDAEDASPEAETTDSTSTSS